MADRREPAPAEYVAIWAFPSEEPGELNFAAGARITVTGKDVPGWAGTWWAGRLPDGSSGIFPADYIKLAPQEGKG